MDLDALKLVAMKNGKTEPGIYTLHRICVALGITEKVFFGEGFEDKE